MRVRNQEILTALISMAAFRSGSLELGTVPVCITNEKLRENVDADSIVDLARVKERRSPMARRSLGEGGRPPT
jgi:hypothetical protein